MALATITTTIKDIDEETLTTGIDEVDNGGTITTDVPTGGAYIRIAVSLEIGGTQIHADVKFLDVNGEVLSESHATINNNGYTELSIPDGCDTIKDTITT